MPNRASRLDRVARMLPKPKEKFRAVLIQVDDGLNESEALAKHLAEHPEDAGGYFIYLHFLDSQHERAA